MATLVTLVDGTVPVAADFNNNFTALNTEVRPATTGGTAQSSWTTGDILYASAANTLSKLGIGKQGQTLGISSSGVPQWGDLFFKSGTAIAVTNSTTETSLINQTLPANTLSTNRKLRICSTVRYTNNTGGNVTFTSRLKYGATTVASIAFVQGTGATNGVQDHTCVLFGTGATNTQGGTIVLIHTGSLDSARGTATEDSTTALTLDLTIQMGTASASASFTMDHVSVELLS